MAGAPPCGNSALQRRRPPPTNGAPGFLPRSCSELSSDVAQIGHDGGQLGRRILPPQLPPRTRRERQRRLEVIDRLCPQNQVLQELCFIRPRLLGHVRKPLIHVAVQETLLSKNSHRPDRHSGGRAPGGHRSRRPWGTCGVARSRSGWTAAVSFSPVINARHTADVTCRYRVHPSQQEKIAKLTR